MAQLTLEKRLEIEKAVERMKLDTGYSYPENGLIQIANALRADVASVDLPDFKGSKVKGLIQWFVTPEEKEANKNFEARIYLNSEQPEQVKNFTLAHEIGHFVLHKGSNNFRIDLQDYSKEGDPQNQETEANFFAGTLLMPKDKFELAVRSMSGLEEVAEAFGVSKPAVESRLKWLGWRVVS